MTDNSNTYSILVHVRRVIHEDAYIGVPVTSAIMKKEKEPDGTYRIDPEKFQAETIRISESLGVEWRQENVSIEPHPIQQPLPVGRVQFDAYQFDSYYTNR